MFLVFPDLYENKRHAPVADNLAQTSYDQAEGFPLAFMGLLIHEPHKFGS